MSAHILTDGDRALLTGIVRRRANHRGLQPPYTGYLPEFLPAPERARVVRQAHRLVRLGYLTREQYSEQVRGEPRFYWWVFTLTAARAEGDSMNKSLQSQIPYRRVELLVNGELRDITREDWLAYDWHDATRIEDARDVRVYLRGARTTEKPHSEE